MMLSVIIPAHNEAGRITATLLDADEFLRRQNFGYEIIVVVNGSRDRTFEIVQNIQATGLKNLRVVNLAQGGKGNAVKHGVLQQAQGDILMFMDADNATPVSEIQKFLPYFQNAYEVVIGSRYLNPKLMRVPPPLYRRILSRLSNKLIQLAAVPGILDTQLGFKAFTRQAARDIFPFLSVRRWAFDIELLTVALNRGHKIKEVPVVWNEPGGSHVSLKTYGECLLDLAKIKYKSLSGQYRQSNSKNHALP